MYFSKFFALAAIASATLASAQTIFDAATAPNNTLGVSQFVGLLSSDPAYKPVIDLLQQPGDYTVFVPNNRAIKKLAKAWKSYAQKNHVEGAGAYPPANWTVNGIELIDIISYHVANTRINLTEINNSNVAIAHSLLNKAGIDKTGNGLPLLITNDAPMAGLNNATWWTENFNDIDFEVGNGAEEADIKIKNLNTSNGNVNIIDSVLMPPVGPAETIEGQDELSTLYTVLAAHPELVTALNNTSNFTLFAPNDDAFAKLGDLSQIDNQTLANVIYTHVVPGIYYSTDIVAAASQNNGMVSVTSLNNVTLPVYFNSTDGTVELNSTINVVKTNIFFNSGVIHVIDGVLMPSA